MGATIGKAVGVGGTIPPPPGRYKDIGSLRVRIPGASYSQIFYPAEKSDEADTKSRTSNKNPGTGYIRLAAIAGLAKQTGVAASLLYNFCNTRHPWLSDQKPARPAIGEEGAEEAGFPVVLFSHGLYGNNEIYSKICGDIASNGYIVVALEHEDGSASYCEPENLRKPLDYQGPPKGFEYNRDNVIDFRRPFLAHRVGEVKRTLQYILAETQPKPQTPTAETQTTEEAQTQTAETQTAEEAQTQTAPSLLASVLACADPTRIFLGGHSFGGASTVMAQLDDAVRPRIRASFILDIWTFPLERSVVQNGLAVPSLSLLSENFALHDEAPATAELINSSASVQSFFIPGTVHNSFSDIPYLTSDRLARQLAARGTRPQETDPGEMASYTGAQPAIIDSVVTFLNAHAQQAPADLGDVVARHDLKVFPHREV